MLKVFMLIKTQIGEAPAVVKALRGLPEITSADATIGPYDVIAEAQVPDAKALGKLVAFEVPVTPGVVDTLTLLAMEI